MRALGAAERWQGSEWPPRRWQAEALTAAVGAVQAGERGLVHAVMGAGKSGLIAELCATFEGATIVVSTPTVALVDQLSETIDKRLGDGAAGRYYTHRKDTEQRVIVACNPSLESLAELLAIAGKRVDLWILDEAHNSACDTIGEAAVLLDSAHTIGLTATPYRAEEREGLDLFDRLIYSYGPKEALADGVVVPFDVRHWTGGQVSIDEACIEMIVQAVRSGMGPGVVDAGGVDAETGEQMQGCADAESFADALCAAGVKASFVHSKISRRLVDERIEQLRTGELDVLVHVAMLKEGVNLPWLRWLCLRRKVGSRVWFAQHVGRVLRAHKGKERAVIFDPHDLFGALSLSYDAVLGGEQEEAERRPPVQVLLDELAEAGVVAEAETGRTLYRVLDRGNHGDVKVLSNLEVGLRRLQVALDTAGIIRPKQQIAAGGWRKRPASEKQLDLVRQSAAKLAKAKGVPEDVLATLRVLYVQAIAGKLSRGATSDFLDVVFGLSRRKWNKTATALLNEGATAKPPQTIDCRACGSKRPLVYTRCGHGPHHAQLVCDGCGAHVRWLTKADASSYTEAAPYTTSRAELGARLLDGRASA